MDKREHCLQEHTPHHITPDDNSWNSNDDEGQEVALLAFFTFVFFLVGTCLFVIIFVRRLRNVSMGPYWLPLLIFVTLIWLVLGIITVIHVTRNPISVSYAFNSLITPVVRTPSRIKDVGSVLPSHTEFEVAHPKIREEVLKFAQHPEKWPQFSTTFGGMEGINTSYTDANGQLQSWRWFLISAGPELTPLAQEQFPSLCELVKKNDNITTCAISLLPPKVKIKPHRGYSKMVIRYMLPIKVPRENCWICINGKPHTWTEGQSFAFDDNFVHSVYNESTETRINLFVDVLREIPDHPWLTSIVQFIYKYVIQNSQAVKNEVRRTEYAVQV